MRELGKGKSALGFAESEGEFGKSEVGNAVSGEGDDVSGVGNSVEKPADGVRKAGLGAGGVRWRVVEAEKGRGGLARGTCAGVVMAFRVADAALLE